MAGMGTIEGQIFHLENVLDRILTSQPTQKKGMDFPEWMLLMQRCREDNRPLAYSLIQSKNGIPTDFLSFWSGVGYAFFNKRALVCWHGSSMVEKWKKASAASLCLI